MKHIIERNIYNIAKELDKTDQNCVGNQTHIRLSHTYLKRKELVHLFALGTMFMSKSETDLCE